MKIIGVIPARYESTRFPGKPLADICGKPMIWWVYQQCLKVKDFSEVYVATDDERISNTCDRYSIKYLMTSKSHVTSTNRVHELAHKISADFYVVVNGDEPLVDEKVIGKIIPKTDTFTEFYVANLMTEIKNPTEVVDYTNIKIVTDKNGYALFMSRSPIPYPKTSILYKYYKHVGILIYNLEALDFFSATQRGYNEKIEDINELRFIENNKPLKMIIVDSDSLSVDTPKDLEKVRAIMKARLSEQPMRGEELA